MTLEEANKRYAELSIKYYDCIPFHPDEDIEWKEVCEIIIEDLRINNPNMLIDIKKSKRNLGG